jgi:cyclopropane fatty-acyl-phospholipid synthase-like methyltransferase
MDKEYFIIKDNCRKGLLKYLSKAISTIPTIKNPLLLDVGCGSGVPTLFLAEKFDSKLIAVDFDTKSVNRLEEKIKEYNLSAIITVLQCSLFDTNLENNLFDLILAEGFLNIVGFQKGFLKLIGLLKKNGYLIIHDDYQNQNKKIKLIEKNKCKILEGLL